jgi:DNA-binding Lrp family transcriptional regulator
LHLSLRRHDPDQVQWVGICLSARQERAPHEIAAYAVIPQSFRRKMPVRLLCRGDFAALLQGEARMIPFFVQIKCQLGKSYQVANKLAEAEIASEIYSTAGEFDLLVKFYIDPATDIGHFVNEKVQVIPGIQDTRTIITFKAFTG